MGPSSFTSCPINASLHRRAGLDRRSGCKARPSAMMTIRRSTSVDLKSRHCSRRWSLRPCASRAPYNDVARLHHTTAENLLPNPASVKGRFKSLTRNVRSPTGDASMIACRAGRIGNTSLCGF